MIILFGLAGSGKGTQGKNLSALFGWRWLSNGEVIRRSHRYDDIINQGKLIPDQDVIYMMNAEIKKAHDEGFDVVLDGYPRDEIQAQYLMEHFADQIKGAIILDVPKEELYLRLAKRGRDDDHSRAAIDQRFAVFEQNIYPILDLLTAHNIPVRHVDGVGPVLTVTERMVDVVNELIPDLKAKLPLSALPPEADATSEDIAAAENNALPKDPTSEAASTPENPEMNNNFIQKENL